MIMKSQQFINALGPKREGAVGQRVAAAASKHFVCLQDVLPVLRHSAPAPFARHLGLLGRQAVVHEHDECREYSVDVRDRDAQQCGTGPGA